MLISPRRRRQRRRTTLAATLLTVTTVAIASSACGDPSGPDATSRSAATCRPAGHPVTIEFWSWVPGIDQAVDLWNSRNPDLQVALTNVPDGSAGTYQNYTNAIKAGKGAPDLGMIEYDTLPTFRLQHALRDLGPCGIAEIRDQFADFTWPLVTFGEREAVYAVPQDTGPLVLFYRPDLFQRYGIEVPRTWNDLVTAARRVHDQDENVYLTNLTGDLGNWFTALVWQNGARWFGRDDAGWTVSIDDPATRQVADLWQQMIDEGTLSHAHAFTEEWNRAASDDRLLSWVSAAWGTKIMELGAPKTAGKWAVAPLPQWKEGATTSANWGGSSYAVFTTSAYPYEAATFARWLTTDPAAVAVLNEQGGAYPAAKAGLDLPALNQPQPFFGGQRIYDVINEAARSIDHSWVWGPTMTSTFAAFQDELGQAIDRRQSLRDALRATQRKTIEDMRAQSLTVTSR